MKIKYYFVFFSQVRLQYPSYRLSWSVHPSYLLWFSRQRENWRSRSMKSSKRWDPQPLELPAFAWLVELI